MGHRRVYRKMINNWKKCTPFDYGITELSCLELETSKTSDNIKYVYVGQFEEEKWNGAGIIVMQDGTIYEGFFKDGYFSEKIRCILPDGTEWNLTHPASQE